MSVNFKKIGGIILALLTSVAYIINIYIVKLAELSASSVSMIRGFMQIIVFSIAIYRHTKKNNVKDEQENKEESKDDIEKSEEVSLTWLQKRKPLFLALLYGFLAGSLSYSFVLGKYLCEWVHSETMCNDIYSYLL